MLITFLHVKRKIKQPTMLCSFLIAAAYRYILQVYVPEHQVVSYLAELWMFFWLSGVAEACFYLIAIQATLGQTVDVISQL